MPVDTPPAIIMPDFDDTRITSKCTDGGAAQKICWTVTIDRRTGCTWFIPGIHGTPVKYACPDEKTAAKDEAK